MHASGGTHAMMTRPDDGLRAEQQVSLPRQELEAGVQYCPGEQT